MGFLKYVRALLRSGPDCGNGLVIDGFSKSTRQAPCP
jgi:hypothetical protein